MESTKDVFLERFEEIKARQNKKEGPRPDYLLCPYLLYKNKNLKPLDRNIYGVVYWFDKMKDGACFASNKTIAGVIGCKQGSVANSLSRLNQEGYIRIDMDNNNHRVRIWALVSMTKRKR